jgi:hypothetical protein
MPIALTRHIAAVGLSIAVAVAAPFAAQSFGTINSLGQNSEHEKITRLALGPMGFQPNSLDEIAGQGGTWGAVGAPDNPARGLVTQSKAHCDNGDFLILPGYPNPSANAQATLTTCQQWMFGNLNAAVNAADALVDAAGNIRDSQIPTIISCTYMGHSGRAKCNVLEALGLAFHAGQDFYSHTNWTDAPMTVPVSIVSPPGLGNTAPAPWIDPRAGAGFPAGLISGCFVFKPESAFCPDRVRHAVLNKDEGAITVATGAIGQGTTPRAAGNDNFKRAVTAAVQDTQNKWAYFKTSVVAKYGALRGNRMICAITNDNPVSTCP